MWCEAKPSRVVNKKLMSIQKTFLGNIFTGTTICLINGLKMISFNKPLLYVLILFGKQDTDQFNGIFFRDW